MPHWSVPGTEPVVDDVLEMAREAAASVLDPRLRWQYVQGHCDNCGIVQACIQAIRADRERRVPSRQQSLQEGDSIGWIER